MERPARTRRFRRDIGRPRRIFQRALRPFGPIGRDDPACTGEDRIDGAIIRVARGREDGCRGVGLWRAVRGRALRQDEAGAAEASTAAAGHRDRPRRRLGSFDGIVRVGEAAQHPGEMPGPLRQRQRFGLGGVHLDRRSVALKRDAAGVVLHRLADRENPDVREQGLRQERLRLALLALVLPEDADDVDPIVGMDEAACRTRAARVDADRERAFSRRQHCRHEPGITVLFRETLHPQRR